MNWRDRFLTGGEVGLKSRESEVEDGERRRLKSVVATVSVENELLREKIARLEKRPPFGVAEVESMSRTLSPSTQAVVRVKFCKIVPGPPIL